MISIVICDSSAIIDLAKARLIENLLRLPYDFVIPDVLFADELITLENYSKHELVDLGFNIGSLDGQGVALATQFIQQHSGPSINDFFALALAQLTTDSILLTGDNRLRKAAGIEKVDVHGVLWVVDEIHRQRVAGSKELIVALQNWHDDETVWLPSKEIEHRIATLSKYQLNEESVNGKNANEKK